MSAKAYHGYIERTSGWPWLAISNARRLLYSLETEYSKTTEEGRKLLQRAQQHLRVEDEKRLRVQICG